MEAELFWEQQVLHDDASCRLMEQMFGAASATGGSAERGGAVAPTFEIERRAQTVPGERRPGEPPLGSPQATAWGPGSSGSAVSGGASPLNVDRLVEVRSTRGRQPMTVEIVREAS